MADVSVNSVNPATIGTEMVAYLLTCSILAGGRYNGGHGHSNGLPLINGSTEQDILRTYAKCMKVVQNPYKVEELL